MTVVALNRLINDLRQQMDKDAVGVFTLLLEPDNSLYLERCEQACVRTTLGPSLAYGRATLSQVGVTSLGQAYMCAKSLGITLCVLPPQAA